MNISDVYYSSVKEETVSGRYAGPRQLDLFLKKERPHWSVQTEGISVEGREIFSVVFGKGPMRILMWSQMHGNESTTTKAVFDIINSLATDTKLAAKLLAKLSIKIIPMLNPDGSFRYERVNANGVDLNRDAQALSQPESRVLKKIYTDFEPDYCFNLHDQRTIYSAGDARQPATLSFLSPSADKGGNLTPARVSSMKIIAAIHKELLPQLGPQIGRYDDNYNLDCVGDTLQSAGIPTLLFEAGHFPGDYQREVTRKYMWYAILWALNILADREWDRYAVEDYNAIPPNQKRYFDFLIRNAEHLDNKYKKGEGVGILFQEVLRNHSIEFHPVIEEVGGLEDRFGHVEYDGQSDHDLLLIKSDRRLRSLFFD